MCNKKFLQVLQFQLYIVNRDFTTNLKIVKIEFDFLNSKYSQWLFLRKKILKIELKFKIVPSIINFLV